MIALVLRNFSLWLVWKTHATFQANQIQSLNYSWFGHPRFPALHALACFYFEFLLANYDVDLRSEWLLRYFGFGFSKLNWKLL